MGTDTTERTISCPCGAGAILITTSSPDHRWPSAYNVSHAYSILCAPCVGLYSVDDGGRVLRRADVAAQNAAWQRLQAAQDAFASSAAIVEIKKAFSAHMDSFKSVAAIYRLLQQNGLESYAIGSFRKNWRGSQIWCADHVASHSVQRILKILGDDQDKFSAELSHIAGLQAGIPNAPTVLHCHR